MGTKTLNNLDDAFVINVTDLPPGANDVVNCVITANSKSVHIVIEGLANAGGIFRTFSNPQFSGGSQGSDFETIIPPNTSLGIEVETGSAGEPIAIICDFYEVER